MCFFVTDGIPTSVDFARDESDKMVCAFSSGQVVLYDLETARPITRLESGVEVTIAFVYVRMILILYMYVTRYCTIRS